MTTATDTEVRPLAVHRRRALLTIRELSAASGVSTRVIQDIEHRKRRPLLSTIDRLCRVLAVKPTDVSEFNDIIEGAW